jgi:hypothetical protein
VSKLDYPRRSSGLFRKADGPTTLPSAFRQAMGEGELRRKVTAAKKAKPSTPKPGRPVIPTGDPKKDARNKRQRELMQKRRKEAK